MDKALERAMTELLADQPNYSKQFSDNESFRRWLFKEIFEVTSQSAVGRAPPSTQ